MFRLNLKEKIKNALKRELTDVLENLEAKGNYSPRTELMKDLKLRRMNREIDVLTAELELEHLKHIRKEFNEEKKLLKERQDYYG